MCKTELPDRRVLNNAFRDRGHSNVVKIDVFPIVNGDLLRLIFEIKDSPWRQGVFLKIDNYLIVNKQKLNCIEVWQDTAPDEVLIECHTHKGILHLYNIWDRGNGLESQSWTSGMLVEETSHGRRYCSNDIGFETKFSKLIFRIERVLKV